MSNPIVRDPVLLPPQVQVELDGYILSARGGKQMSVYNDYQNILEQWEVLRFILHELTPKELTILLLMVAGHTSDKELAVVLHRSPATINYHISHMLNKSGTKSRHELTTFILRSKLNLLLMDLPEDFWDSFL